MKITKSKYVQYCLCPIKAWFDEFDQIEEKENSRSKIGTDIGILARDIFGRGIVRECKGFPFDKPGIYAEFPLKFYNLECFVDILRINEDKTIDMFEVKSVNNVSSNDEEETPKLKVKYLEDLSFQYYVAIQLGYKVKSINAIKFNKNYVHDGSSTYDLSKLFQIIDSTNEVRCRVNEVEKNIGLYMQMAKNNSPKCLFCSGCKEDGGCQYLERCKKLNKLSENQSVFDLYRYSAKQKNALIEKGIRSWEELKKSDKYDGLSSYNKLMIEYSLSNSSRCYVNHGELLKYLKTFVFPLYFFDFETVQYVVPVFANSKPYQQITFQYSLHVMKNPNSTFEEVIKDNLYFLGDGVKDPREDLIIKMLNDLGKEGTIVAYHASFECSRIKELACAFPKYSKDLLELLPRFKDLEDVFKCCKTRCNENKPWTEFSDVLVYNPLQLNSCSIKHVLPAFFPNDPEYDYHKLEQVHKGDEASEAYLKLKILSDEERDKLRENMLKYCCLDTKAMVAIYFELLKLIN